MTANVLQIPKGKKRSCSYEVVVAAGAARAAAAAAAAAEVQ